MISVKNKMNFGLCFLYFKGIKLIHLLIRYIHHKKYLINILIKKIKDKKQKHKGKKQNDFLRQQGFQNK